jgi:hypothetical protein
MSQVESQDVADVQEVPAVPAPRLSSDERVELERLRAEVRTMQRAPAPRRKLRWRSIVAVVLIVLGCVLAPVAGLAVWSNNQVSNTDRFVRTMSPLVDDPDVQAALTNRVTDTIFQFVDVQGLTDQAVSALVSVGLPPQLGTRLETLTPTLASAVTSFVHGKVAEVVASPQFSAVWDRALRVAHTQLDSILSGNSKSVVVRNGSVFLDLAPFIDVVKKDLSQAGLTAVKLVPEVHPTVKVADAKTLVRAQGAYKSLNTVANVLPWIVLLIFAVGIYLARNRFRALVGVGLGLVLSMVVLAAGLLIARSLLISEVPSRAAPATGSGFDILVHYLRLGLRALIVLGLVLAIAGFLSGKSDTAVRIRRGTAKQLHRIRGGPAAGGPVATWVRGHVKGLRIAAVAVAVLTFVFLSQPSGVAILVIAALLLLVLAIIEFLARPGEPAPVTDGAT